MGFWKVRVSTQGQTEELPFKVETHYLPHYELVVAMPSFTLDNEDFIEASVEGAFLTERTAKGNTLVNWYAKKIDYSTPMYNDTVLYREVIFNLIFSSFIHFLLFSYRTTNIYP